MFCAVSLAIVWGTTLERIKFGVYLIYGVVFSAIIYPLVSGWVFGGGWLQNNIGMQDFAGSTAVHLIGATGAFAALLLLGPRRGKYGPDGKPRAIPGHNMPLFGLGIFILWLGWFGFNPGSTLNATDGRFTEVLLVTQLAGLCRRARRHLHGLLQDQEDRHRHGGQRRDRRARRDHRSVGLRRAVGGGRSSACVAGVIVVLGVYAIDKWLDDPVGALSAHGLAGIWGTLSCGLFTDPDAGEVQRGRRSAGSSTRARSTSSGPRLSASWWRSSRCSCLSFATFCVIKKTYGLRVTAEEEEAGLDISEHGMYGYPEQFIPEPELIGYGAMPADTKGYAGAAPALRRSDAATNRDGVTA